MKWPTYRKECSEWSAVLWARKIFKKLLLFRPFHIYTDHKPILYLKRTSNLSPVLQRNLEFISQFNFKIFHVKGRHNSSADALSRIIVTPSGCTNIPDGVETPKPMSYDDFCKSLENEPNSSNSCYPLESQPAERQSQPNSLNEFPSNTAKSSHNIPITEYF